MKKHAINNKNIGAILFMIALLLSAFLGGYILGFEKAFKVLAVAADGAFENSNFVVNLDLNETKIVDGLAPILNESLRGSPDNPISTIQYAEPIGPVRPGEKVR